MFRKKRLVNVRIKIEKRFQTFRGDLHYCSPFSGAGQNAAGRTPESMSEMKMEMKFQEAPSSRSHQFVGLEPDTVEDETLEAPTT